MGSASAMVIPAGISAGAGAASTIARTIPIPLVSPVRAPFSPASSSWCPRARSSSLIISPATLSLIRSRTHSAQRSLTHSKPSNTHSAPPGAHSTAPREMYVRRTAPKSGASTPYGPMYRDKSWSWGGAEVG